VWSLWGVATVFVDFCRLLCWGIIMQLRNPSAFGDACKTSLFSHHALGLQFSPLECLQPVQTLDIGEVESHVEQVRMIPQGGKII